MKVIDRLARAFYPAILACWNGEEGQQEFTHVASRLMSLARKTGSSRWGTPCLHHRVWIFAAVRVRGAPVSFEHFTF